MAVWMSKQRFFKWPTGCKPSSQRCEMKVETLCPDGKAKRFTLKGDEVIFACILHLFLACCPTAVAGGVGAVVVNALYFATCRPRPHVVDEVCKAGSPTVAYVDSATTVTGEMRVGLAVAALNHCPPDTVHSRLFVAPAMAMFQSRLPVGLNTNAWASLGVAARQMVATSSDYRSAFATTQPEPSHLMGILAASGKADYFEFAKTQTRNVTDSRRDWKNGFGVHVEVVLISMLDIKG